jgi:hypothetical protein
MRKVTMFHYTLIIIHLLLYIIIHYYTYTLAKLILCHITKPRSSEVYAVVSCQIVVACFVVW